MTPTKQGTEMSLDLPVYTTLAVDVCKAYHQEPVLCQTPESGKHIHPAGRMSR